MEKKKKKVLISIIGILFLMIGILSLKYLVLDKYNGKVLVKNVESYSTVLSANVANLSSDTNLSESYDTVKYTIKYTLDNTDNITRDVTIRVKLTASESKYARFRELKGNNISSEVSEDGIIVNLTDVPTNEEQTVELDLVISNAPYGFKVEPTVTIKEDTSDEKIFNLDEITVSRNSIEGTVQDEKGNKLSSVELSLIEDGKEVKRVYTDTEGEYVFGNLDNNKTYTINVEEDIYKKLRLEERSASSEKKVYDVIVRSVNPFELDINKYITKLDLVINGKKESYVYEDSIKVLRSVKNAKTIEGSITYKISVKNTGEIDGTIGSIQDIVPAGLSFNESKNPGWEEKNGKLYYRVLEDNILTSYEERTISLILDIVKTNEAKTYINEAIGKSNEYKNVVFLIDGNVYKDINVLSDEVIDEVLVDGEFSGWYTDANFTNKYNFKNKVTKNMILYGSLSKSKCKVTFIDEGNILKEDIIDCGSKIESITSQGKEGYTFKYWTLNGQEYDFESKVNSDIILNSYYEIINYTITYNLNGGNVSGNPIKYTIESSNITLNNPEKEGYTFTGWTGTGLSDKTMTVVIPTGSTGDRTYEANYNINRSSLTIEPNGGIYNGSINPIIIENDYGTVITLDTPEKRGYTFKKWNHDGGGSLSGGSYTYGNTNGRVTAEYDIINYDITYSGLTDEEKTILNNPIQYNVLSSFTLTNPQNRTDSDGDVTEIFSGWKYGDTVSTVVTIEAGTIGNMSYEAIFTPKDPNVYSISYNTNGGTVTPSNPVNYTKKTETFTLNNPTKEGYTFKGWSGTDLTGDKNTTVTITKGSRGNREYEAHYTPDEYTITYEGLTDVEKTALNNPTSYTIESEAILLNNPTREGYRFTGWTGSNGNVPTNVNIPTGSTGNKTYTANFEIINYTISYDTKGGTVSGTNPTSYTIESEAITLINPTKEGYTFLGWTGTDYPGLSDSVVIPAGSIGNRSFEAHFSADEYTITYEGLTDAEKTTLNNPTSYTIESNSITLNNPTREGYAFTGWTGSNGNVPQLTITINHGSTGNKEYTANFDVNSYTVTYKNGESIHATDVVEYNHKTTAPVTNPVRSHSYFSHWSTSENGEAFDFDTLITDNLTLYAVFNTIEAPTITHTPTTWTNDKVLVNISSSHDDYEYYYKIADGEYTKFTSDFEVSENTTIYAYSSYSNGTSSEASHEITNIDKINPQISVEGTAYVHTYDLDLSFIDNESGVKSYKIYLGDTLLFESDDYVEDLNEQKNEQYTLASLEASTEYTYKIVLLDVAGNEEEYERTITTLDAIFVAKVIGMGGLIFDDPSQDIPFESLQAAINYCDDTQCTIQLIPDSLEESVTVAQGQDITLDLDGKTLYSSNLSTIENNGNLVILDYSNDLESVSRVINSNPNGTAIVNNEILTIGINETNSVVSVTNPSIESANIGINNLDTLRFFDGIVKGEESVHGEVNLTPYAYNASIKFEDNKEIMTLQIVEEPEARINSKYYNKLSKAMNDSKSGTLEDSETETNYLSQIVEIGDYGFVYNPTKNIITSENIGSNNTLSLSMLKLDLTDYTENQFLHINYSISSQIDRDYGYITILEEEGYPLYNQTNGRILCTSGIRNNYDIIKELTPGKKYYIYFGYNKDSNYSLYDDSFIINSLTLSGKGSSDFEDMIYSADRNAFTRVDKYYVLNDLSGNASPNILFHTLNNNVVYNDTIHSLDYNNASLGIHYNQSHISIENEETVDVVFSTTYVGNQNIYGGNQYEKISIGLYGGYIIVSRGISSKTYKIPSNFTNGRKHRITVSYNYDETNGHKYYAYFDGDPLEENEGQNSYYYGNEYTYVGGYQSGNFNGSIYKTTVYDKTLTPTDIDNNIGIDNILLKYDLSDSNCVTVINDDVYLSNSPSDTTSHSYFAIDLRNENEALDLLIDLASYNSSWNKLSVKLNDNENNPGLSDRHDIWLYTSEYGFEKTYLLKLQPGIINYVHFNVYKDDSNNQEGFIIKNVRISNEGNENKVYEKEKVDTSQYHFIRYNSATIKDLAGTNDYVDDLFNNRYDDDTKALVFDGNKYSFESGLSFDDEETLDIEFSTTNTGNKSLYCGSTNEKLAFGIYNNYIIVSPDVSKTTFKVPNDIYDGSKHRVTVIYSNDLENGEIYKVYYDGIELEQNGTKKDYFTADTYSYLGGSKNGNQLNGSIYNLKIYDKSLTPTEIDSNIENENLKLYYNVADSRNIIVDNQAYMSNNRRVSYSVAHSYIPYDLTNSDNDIYLNISYTISSDENDDIGYITVNGSTEDPGYNNVSGRYLYVSGSSSGNVYVKLTKGRVNYLHFGYRKDYGYDQYDDVFIINSITYSESDEDIYSINKDRIASATQKTKIPILNETVSKVELLKDITVDYVIEIPEEKEVILDLNGHVLNTSKTDYLINNKGNLTIQDSKYENDKNVIYNQYVEDLEEYNRLILYYKNAYIEDFDYTGDEQTFTAPVTGYYDLEVWGAQGGSVQGYTGGYGGYSRGTIKLEEGETIYINVGETGSASKIESTPATYNGGGAGKGGDCSTYTNRWGSSGGGATSISKVSGELKELDEETDKPNIIIVAGGGGGSFNIDNWYTGNGGHAGGYVGTNGSFNRYEVNYPPYGGSQESGGRAGTNYNIEAISDAMNGSFGLGGSAATWECGEGAGGGGGFYGGGPGYSASGGGGSGYIGNESLTKKKMVCYNCSTSNDEDTKTISVATHSATAVSDSPKEGNGYARVTLRGTTLNNQDVTLEEAIELVNTIEGVYEPVFDYSNIVRGEATSTTYSTILNDDNASLTIEKANVSVNKSGTYSAIINHGNITFGEDSVITTKAANNIGVKNETVGKIVSSDNVQFNINGNSNIGLFNNSQKSQEISDVNFALLGNSTAIIDNAYNTMLYKDISITGTGNGLSLRPKYPLTINNVNVSTTGNGITFEDKTSIDISNKVTTRVSNSSFVNGNYCFATGTYSDHNILFYNDIFIENGSQYAMSSFSGNVVIDKSTISTNSSRAFNNRSDLEIRNSTISAYYEVFVNGNWGGSLRAKLTLDSSTLNMLGGSWDSIPIYNRGSDVFINDTTINVSRTIEYAISNDSTSSTTITGNTEFNGGMRYAVRNSGVLSVGEVDKKYNTVFDYDYTGSVQEFVAPKSGNYRFETWGASGGNYGTQSPEGGKGAYASGDIYLEAGTKLYIYVGEQGTGTDEYSSKRGTYNGGTPSSSRGGTGGGATDISISNEEVHEIITNYSSLWFGNIQYVRSLDSYLDRIMVAGAGGGSVESIRENKCLNGVGLSLVGLDCGTIVPKTGSQVSGNFGYYAQRDSSWNGKGAGYFTNIELNYATGGTSYISGYKGSVAMKSDAGSFAPISVDGVECADGTNDVRCSYHTSGYVFTNTVMKAGYEKMPTFDGNGYMIGNYGDGHAKVTLLDEYTVESVSSEYPKLYGTTGAIYGEGTINDNTVILNSGVLSGAAGTVIDTNIDAITNGYELYSEKTTTDEKIYLIPKTSTDNSAYEAAIVDNNSSIISKYTTVKDAVDAVSENTTTKIILLKDVVTDYAVTVPENKDVIIDYKGHYLKSYSPEYAFTNNGKLKLMDSVTTNESSIAYGKGYIYNNGEMVVDSLNLMTYYNCEQYIVNNNLLTFDDVIYYTSKNNIPNSNRYSITNNENATFNINGGEYYTQVWGWLDVQRVLANYGTAYIKDMVYTSNHADQHTPETNYIFYNGENATLTFDNLIATRPTGRPDMLVAYFLNNDGDAEFKDSSLNVYSMINHGNLKYTSSTFGDIDTSKVENVDSGLLTIDGGNYNTNITNKDDASVLIKSGNITRTIETNSTGSVTVESGNITVTQESAIVANSSDTINIGIKGDGNTSITSPNITGTTYGINMVSTDAIMNFYDGIVNGNTAIKGTVGEVETNYSIKLDINNSVESKYLVQLPIVKNLTTNIEYLDINTAFSEASDNDTLQLLRDAEIPKSTSSINNTKTLTFDLNSYRLEVSNDNFIVNTGNLTIIDSVYDSLTQNYKTNVNSTYNSLVSGSLLYKTYNYYYSNDIEQVFIAPYTGTYRLSTWGASGGDAKEYIGGYGAYSEGEINLVKGEKLYINVGGAGIDPPQVYKEYIGSYNGGGSSGWYWDTYEAPGGGATSIATKSGKLSTLSDSINDILIVAGGGGGGYYSLNSDVGSGYGGSAGGIKGSDGTSSIASVVIGRGATQTAGGSGRYNDYYGKFGAGANGLGRDDGAGAGGGFYGGGVGGNGSGGGGGSSYIGNSRLTNKSMVCYDCITSNDTDTKTISVNTYNSTPNEGTPNDGDGFVRIVLLSTSEDTSDIEYTKDDARAYVTAELGIQTPMVDSTGIIELKNLNPIITNNGTLTINSGSFIDEEIGKYRTLFKNNGTMYVNDGIFEKSFSLVDITEIIPGSIFENYGTLNISDGEFKNPDKYRTLMEQSSAPNTAFYNKNNGVINVTGGRFNSYSFTVEQPTKGRMFYNDGTINMSNIVSNYSLIGVNNGTVSLNDCTFNLLSTHISFCKDDTSYGCNRWADRECSTDTPTIKIFLNEGIANITGGTYITDTLFVTNRNILNINNNSDKQTIVMRKAATSKQNDMSLKNDIIHLFGNASTSINNTVITSYSGNNIIKHNSTGLLEINNTEINAKANQVVIDNTATGDISINESKLYADNNYVINRKTNNNILITESDIISRTTSAINNTGAGTITIGTKGDGTVSKVSPLIMGSSYGILSNNNSLVLNFYDGIIKGKTSAIEATITDLEFGYSIKDDTEVIDGNTYKTKYLDKVKVVQNNRTLESFFDLKTAFDNVNDGDTLKMIDNFTTLTTDEPIEINDTVTLDLNGYELNKSIDYLFINKGTFTITDSSDDNSGFMYALSGLAVIDNEGTLILDRVHSKSKNTSSIVINESTGTVDIVNGSYLHSDTDTNLIKNYNVMNIEDSKLEISLTDWYVNMIINYQGGLLNIKDSIIGAKNGYFRCVLSGDYHSEAIRNSGTLVLDNISFVENPTMTLLINETTGDATIKNITSTDPVSLAYNAGILLIKDSDVSLANSACYDRYFSITNGNQLTIENSTFRITEDIKTILGSWGTTNISDLTVIAPGRRAEFYISGGTTNIDNLNTIGNTEYYPYTRFQIFGGTLNIENSNILYGTPLTYDKGNYTLFELYNSSVANIESSIFTTYSSGGSLMSVYNSATLNILSGTYIATNSDGIVTNDANTKVSLGTNDSVYNQTDVVIKSPTYAVNNDSGTFNYYDGTLYGITAGHIGRVTAVEDGYRIRTGTEDGYNITYQTLVGSTEAVAESNSIVFDDLQTAVNYAARNNTYVTLVEDITLSSDLISSVPVDIYLDGNTLTLNGYTTTNITIKNGSYNPSGSIGNLFNKNNKIIIIYEMDDGSELESNINYRLYKDDKLIRVDEEEAGTYSVGSSDEVLKPIKGRIYINEIGAGNYKLVGSNNKEVSFSIREGGKVSGNVKEYTYKNNRESTVKNAKAELILTIQTGVRKVNYLIIAISLISVLVVMLIIKRKSQNNKNLV